MDTCTSMGSTNRLRDVLVTVVWGASLSLGSTRSARAGCRSVRAPDDGEEQAGDVDYGCDVSGGYYCRLSMVPRDVLMHILSYLRPREIFLFSTYESIPYLQSFDVDTMRWVVPPPASPLSLGSASFHNFASTHSKNCLFVLHVIPEGSTQYAMFYNIMDNTWNRTEPMMGERFTPNAAMVFNQYAQQTAMIVTGGVLWKSVQLCTVLSTAEMLILPSHNSADLLKWTYIPDMHFPRLNHASAVIDGNLFVSGGVQSTKIWSPGEVQQLAECEILKWTPNNPMEWIKAKPMHCHRVAHSLARNNQTRQIYAIAGSTTPQSAEVYDENSDCWLELPQLPHSYPWPACAWIQGRLFVSGNQGASCYDPRAGTWHSLPPTNAHKSKVSHRQSVVAVDDKLLFVVSRTEASVFNTVTNTWTEMPPPDTSSPGVYDTSALFFLP
ncbi:hypothetical protein Pelo_14059 [Pelomyxa schiedti]|nr:hypothetical protein Pelo_14059 [Pelomyxa schiedti]